MQTKDLDELTKRHLVLQENIQADDNMRAQNRIIAVHKNERLSGVKAIWHKLINPQGEPSLTNAPLPRSEKKRRWRLIQVESAVACNLKCVMCPWKEYRGEAVHRGIMRQEVWEAVRPYLQEVQSVDFTGGGEPLLQPKLADWIREAKSAGCETGILTNAVLLDKGTAEKLMSAGLDWVCVSIDGANKEQYESIRIGADFEKVCENVANFARLRIGLRPRTMINFVMMSSNFHQVEDIARLAAHLGVDQVNFKQCEVIRGEHGKGYGIFGSRETRETNRLQKALTRARSLAKKLRVHTTASSFTPSERPVCEQDPRDSLFVRYDGVLSPCISLAYDGRTTFLGRDVIMPHMEYGRLPGRDLLELWDSEGCKFYRDRFQERARAYEETFMAGLTGDSYLTPQKLMETASRRMPDAPESCKICHYLYGI